MFELLQMNRCYELTNFKVGLENDKYPSGSGNVLYIALLGNFEIKELDDDGIFGDLPKLAFNFTGLKELSQVLDKVPIGKCPCC